MFGGTTVTVGRLLEEPGAEKSRLTRPWRDAALEEAALQDLFWEEDCEPANIASGGRGAPTWAELGWVAGLGAQPAENGLRQDSGSRSTSSSAPTNVA